MVLSESLKIIQNDLMSYFADTYIDLDNIYNQGKNRLNTELSKYGIKFAFSNGKVDRSNSNILWVLFEGATSEGKLLGGLNVEDTITLSINAVQTVNSTNSTLSYNMVNAIIQDILREWYSNFRNDDIAIKESVFTIEQPAFYFTDNTVYDFNSINAIRYTNKITFKVLTYKE